MKTCPECSTLYPDDRLVCLECGEIFEDPPYTRFIGVTVVVGALLQLGVSGLGPTSLAFWKETFMHGALLLSIGYPSWKVVQKLREPSRPTLAEMGSVFGSRSDRLMLLGLLLFLVYSAPTLWPTLTSLAVDGVANDAATPAWLASFRALRALILTLVAAVVPLAAMIDQGLAFFDPRVVDTYILREVQRVLIDDGESPIDGVG
ncbi:MAG: hypothetical protein AAGE94_22870 [Acidobacteriota bacterium]